MEQPNGRGIQILRPGIGDKRTHKKTFLLPPIPWQGGHEEGQNRAVGANTKKREKQKRQQKYYATA